MSDYYCDSLFDHDKLSKMVHTVGSHLSRDYKKGKFNCLVVTGVSGMVLGSAISFRYDIPLAIVRKDESTHSTNQVEGLKPGFVTFAFLDDFISGGSTLARVMNCVKVVKVYLWSFNWSSMDTNKINTTKDIFNYLPDLPCKVWHRDLWEN